jgi:hypothetical protein
MQTEVAFFITFVLFLLSVGPLDSGFWACQIDGVKEYFVDMCLWRLVVNSSLVTTIFFKNYQ